MATERQLLAWANIPPDERDADQQAEVTRGRNIQSVRNADFAAHIAAGLQPPSD